MADRFRKRDWSYDLPPHDALEGLSREERAAIGERIHARLRGKPARTMVSIAASVAGITAGLTLNKPLALWLQSFGVGRLASFMIGASIPAAVASILVLVVGYWFIWNVVLKAFRAALAESGREVCVQCGYWLQGLSADETRCPECGAEREAANSRTDHFRRRCPDAESIIQHRER